METKIENSNISIEELIETRTSICKECPLYSDVNEGVCNSNLWINPETDEISTSIKSNYVRGCGCLLSSKISNEFSVCPASKW